MGNLITLAGGDKRDPVEIFLDFENAQPQSDEERATYDQAAQVLDKAPQILDKLTNYTGCEEHIRKAITNPGPETEDEAWLAVLPAVEQLKEFYDYSIELEQCFPKLLTALCQDDPKTNLEKRQALAKQFANAFDFVLRFDDLKMLNPAIQNDFSYYRRTLNRMKLSKKHHGEITIKDELANRMSLFFAYPTPMMNVINETTSNFLSQNQSVPQDNLTTALALMASVCEDMVTNKRFQKDDTNMFCLRCMTGAIILYDHLHSHGAFSKKSGIPIRACITILKTYQPQSGGSTTDGLLNALRFTTVHLNDPETPNNIKQLLE
eukprot:CAMPEP_0201476638 /NCGR_PEP_ID=MMETSP0151_2-20130828/1796_1 /ASSEMBLY_ACC=CAM_ASM_000257 /TAXON_ID=200890 /ORGANISM="Paramoeba atlantica, Strain 621/1 / CCAP 1560/9" /LENGTH=320 /DNA_ID=CAMNT_0047857063 /DNA_START=86 /DNA_END=1048 /DNA_ORIENTATION=-